MKQSSELAFIDSSSNMEELNLRVFIVCTHSVAGALPLGILIVSDERTATLVQGFTLLKNCMGENAFFCRQSLGPMVIMTDNCSELRDALKIVWPESRLLLCIFHLMQQVWRWLYEKKNGIHADHRQEILSLMKSIIYAETEDISERTDDLLEHSLLEKYPNAAKYLGDVLEFKESWALAYRTGLPVRGNNTNNYVEAQFLVIKDELLNRVREYNVVGLVDKLTINLEEHYMTKLLSIADGSFDGVYSARFKGLMKNLPPSHVLDDILKNVVSVGNEVFKVPSFTCANVEYLVDMNLSQCECPIGSNGAPCKHQYLLWLKNLSTMSRNFLPIFNGKERQQFAKLAVGVAGPDGLYEGIRDRIPNMHPVADQRNPEPASTLWDETISPTTQVNEMENGELHQSTNSESCTTEKYEAEKALDEAFNIIKEKLETGPNFVSAVLKFSERVCSMSDQRLASALHCFNSDSTRSAPKVSKATRQAKQNKIKVQPEAVRRRKTKNGSRQRQSKSNFQVFRSVIPSQAQQTGKRLHSFAHNVANNEPVAKKSGRSMMSVTKSGRKRV
jgi:hypothetical protein